MSVEQCKWDTGPRDGSYVKILPKLKNLVTFITSATKSNTDFHPTLLRSLAATVAQCVRAFTPQAKVWRSNSSRQRPKSLKQEGSGPLPNAGQ